MHLDLFFMSIKVLCYYFFYLYRGHLHISYQLGVKRGGNNANIAEYDEGGLGKPI